MASVLAPFISEGGAIEVDGEGTMLTTESSILNPNRNPGLDKDTLERHFADYLGVKKTIWLPGARGLDITDDHIDALARFASPGTVLLSRKHSVSGNVEAHDIARSIFSNATDASGRSFRILEVPEPDPAEVLGTAYRPEDGPCVSYVNFHLVNGAVIVPAFGDTQRDQDAAEIIGSQFPGRVVEQVHLRQLAIQGGGVHCATQQLLPMVQNTNLLAW